MAAEAIVSGVTEILIKLSSVAAGHINLALNLKDDFKKLQKTLEIIRAVIADAEKKQVNSDAARLWLRRLKDTAYDADDILDRFSYEGMRRRDEGLRLKYKVRNLLSYTSLPHTFRQKMAYKIKKINLRFEEIANNKAWLDSPTSSTTSAEASSVGRQKTSVVDDSDIIVGSRINDIENIIGMLIGKPPSSASSSSAASSSSSGIRNADVNVSVIPIVGMGGIGKTKVAQLVYNDDRVKDYFKLKIWVSSVTHNFNDRSVLREIILYITDREYNDVSTEFLVNKVRNLLDGKRYLLVLDDLWTVNSKEWNTFRSHLAVGALGSKILITTRKRDVAKIVIRDCIEPYTLQKITPAECWSIMRERAFRRDGPKETQKMIEIGLDIAKKCGGVPHVAADLGSRMHSKKRESDWVDIRENTTWDNSILKLSYDLLPSYLKQCFSYFYIFPKESEIKRETFIQLWMAEGFLPNQSNDKIEEIGNDYFNRLLGDCFFQDEQQDEFGDIEKCKMHDHVHDLAKSLVDDHELISIGVPSDQKVNTESQVRRRIRLLFKQNVSGIPEALYNRKKLRTIVAIQAINCEKIESCFKNKHLRVLDVRGSSIKKLPSSIAKLRHLRYLDLSQSKGLEVLHDKSICRLYNLQTLVLHECDSLGSLPRNIGTLTNLRHLDLSGCKRIRELPASLTNLSNLRTLNLSQCTSFDGLPHNVGDMNGLQFLDLSSTDVRELPGSTTSLSNLRVLKINSCSKLEALPGGITDLEYLRRPDISGTKISKSPWDSKKSK